MLPDRYSLFHAEIAAIKVTGVNSLHPKNILWYIEQWTQLRKIRDKKTCI